MAPVGPIYSRCAREGVANYLPAGSKAPTPVRSAHASPPVKITLRVQVVGSEGSIMGMGRGGWKPGVPDLMSWPLLHELAGGTVMPAGVMSKLRLPRLVLVSITTS